MKHITPSSVITLAFFAAVSFFHSFPGFPLGTILHTEIAHADTAIDTWWPVNNAVMSGTQPFKALVPNLDVNAYALFWSVDGGQLNAMANNYSDYPHKEAMVDLSNWNWHGTGPYVLDFVAKDFSGNKIASAHISIYLASPLPDPVSVSAPVVTAPPTTISAPVSQPNPVINITALLPVSTKTEHISIWWPTDNAHVSGTFPLKALLDNSALSNYQMFWSVDGGQVNVMNDNETDYPHKETSIDVSGWNWRGAGPYVLTFAAKNSSGNEIATHSVSIYTDNGSRPQTSLSSAPVISPMNTLSNLTLYTDPHAPARAQADEWRSTRPQDAALMDKIASTATAKWFGDWNTDIQKDVSTTMSEVPSGTLPVFVAYNIPQRDCGSYSAGGATPNGYTSWIQSFANGLHGRKTLVILEPDALAGMNCLSSPDQNTRLMLIKNAVDILKSQGALVYIDAGNAHWIGAGEMATRLKNAGIAEADGFSLNVSNFYPTSDNIAFGSRLSSLLSGAHFVIDTSRNGVGSNGEWCNPSGRALGTRSTTLTGNPIVDALLWIKYPGESDGTCNGGPAAGVWWPDYALGLAARTGF